MARLRSLNLSMRLSTAVATPRVVCVYVLSVLLSRLGSFAVVLLGWAFIASLTGDRLPGPQRSIAELREAHAELMAAASDTEPSLVAHAVWSGARAGGGLLIGTFLFVPLGALCGLTGRGFRATSGFLEFARSIPAFMLVVVLVSLSIRGEWARMTCVSFAVGVLLADYSASAVRAIPPARLEILCAMRAPRWQAVLRQATVPLLLNAVLPACRIGVGVAIIVSIVVEAFLVPTAGLGRVFSVLLGRVDFGGALALTLLSGVLGWVGNMLVGTIADIAAWVYLGQDPRTH